MLWFLQLPKPKKWIPSKCDLHCSVQAGVAVEVSSCFRQPTRGLAVITVAHFMAHFERQLNAAHTAFYGSFRGGGACCLNRRSLNLNCHTYFLREANSGKGNIVRNRLGSVCLVCNSLKRQVAGIFSTRIVAAAAVCYLFFLHSVTQVIISYMAKQCSSIIA